MILPDQRSNIWTLSRDFANVSKPRTAFIKSAKHVDKNSLIGISILTKCLCHMWFIICMTYMLNIWLSNRYMKSITIDRLKLYFVKLEVTAIFSCIILHNN